VDQFRKALLEAVNEGLLALGESARHAIYSHLERRGSIRREEVPDRLGDFASALEGLIGAGAKVLEKAMVKRLYSKLGLAFKEVEGYGFLDYVEDAKRQWQGKAKSQR
jgi:hypothetical protein